MLRGVGKWLRSPALWLLALLATHLVVNAIWILADRTLRGEDMATQIGAQAHALQVLLEQGIAGVWTVLRGRAATQWPSASALPMATAALIVGQSLVKLRLLQMCWLALLLAATYRVGARLRSPAVGLLAAALLSLYPAIHGTSRQYGADLPGTAMVAWTMAILVSPGCFTRLWPSLLLGASVGLGVLVRPHSLFFVLVPMAVLFAVSLRRGASGKHRLLVLGRAAAAAAVALALCSPWWWGRLTEITAVLSTHAGGQLEAADPNREPLSFLFYLRSLPMGLTSWLLVALAVSLVGAYFAGLRRAFRGTLQVWVWLAAGFVAMSLIGVQSPRYLLPVYAPVALITALGLCSIRHRRARRTVTATVLGVAALSWLVCSFDPLGPKPCRPPIDLPLDICGHWHLGGAGPPAVYDLHRVSERAAGALHRRHPHGGEGVVVRLITDPGQIEWTVFLKALLMTRLPGAVLINRSLTEYPGPPGKPPSDMVHILGGLAFPESRQEPRHCYTVQVSRRDSVDMVGEPASKLLAVRDTALGDPVHLTVFWHPRCRR